MVEHYQVTPPRHTKVKGIEQTWENGMRALLGCWWRRGKKGTQPWALGCQHCLLTLAEGPCSGAQCEFEKEVGNTLECDWCHLCLEIRSKVSVMSPIIRQCARGVWSESETGECSWHCPQSFVLLLLQRQPIAGSTWVHLECTSSAALLHASLVILWFHQKYEN